MSQSRTQTPRRYYQWVLKHNLLQKLTYSSPQRKYMGITKRTHHIHTIYPTKIWSSPLPTLNQMGFEKSSHPFHRHLPSYKTTLWYTTHIREPQLCINNLPPKPIPFKSISLKPLPKQRFVENHQHLYTQSTFFHWRAYSIPINKVVLELLPCPFPTKIPLIFRDYISFHFAFWSVLGLH